MNPETFAEARRLFDATKKLATTYKKVAVVIAPPAIFLRSLAKEYRGTRIEFSAQTIYQAVSGSHTGELSPTQVHDSGATYTIIGHAERRAMGESNKDIHEKVLAALAEKLDPIIAIGEHERDVNGEYVRGVRTQITTALADVPQSRFKNITIAYEPIWAIGASEAPDAHLVHQMMLLVKKTLADNYGEKAMKKVRVIYGGSVNETNGESILAVPNLNGILIGRAGLDPQKLEILLKIAQTA